jgi:hypothetical protein
MRLIATRRPDRTARAAITVPYDPAPTTSGGSENSYFDRPGHPAGNEEFSSFLFDISILMIYPPPFHISRVYTIATTRNPAGGTGRSCNLLKTLN